MSSGSLWHDIKNNPLALIAAVALHAVLIVLLSMNLVNNEVHIPDRPKQKTVKAVVVDAAQVEKEIARLKQKEDDKQQTLKREQDKIKQQLAAEKKRLADLKKKQIAEEKKRKAEIKKQAELKKQREAERRKKLAAEKKRKQEQAKKAQQAKIEAERKRKEEERQKKIAAEKKRKQEEAERRKQEEEELKRKLAEEERLEREAQQAAARQTALNKMRAQYVRMIEQKVERSWLRPAAVTTASACEVYVTQSVLGDVLDVKLSSCQNNAAYKRSIERAVRRASPLPPPPDPDVFDKEIHFVFRPQT